MIRRLSLLSGVLLLVSCGTGGTSVSPKDLLEKAADAQQHLTQTNIHLTMDLNGQATADLSDIHIDVRGSVESGGTLAGVHGTVQTTAQGTPLVITGDAVLLNASEEYLRLTQVQADTPAGPMTINQPSLNGFLNRWWLLPGQPTVQNGAHADPSLLPMEVDVLDVVKDEGTQQINGHPLRTLDVKVNPERLKDMLDQVTRERGDAPNGGLVSFLQGADAHGTLVIAEDTALLQSVHWEITPPGKSTSTLDLQMDPSGSVMSIERPDGALPLVPGVSPLSLFLQTVSPESGSGASASSLSSSGSLSQ